MIYRFLHTYCDSDIYANDEGRSCIKIDKEFQRWLRANKDDLPDDIQAKIYARELTIDPADNEDE